MALDLSRIGQLLRETREAKGLTLEDVSSTLFLRKSVVNALETGDWEKLPHEVYVRGYLNQYAAFLNIEERFAKELESCTEPDESPETASEEMKDGVPPCESLPTGSEKAARPGTPFPRRRLVAYGIGFCVLLAFLVYQNIPRPYPPGTSGGTYGVSNTRYESPTRPSDTATTVLEPKKLVIACQERTWLRVLIDEGEKKEFMLNPDEMVAITAKEGFDLLIGNAGGVTLFFNGKNVGPLGRNGEVKRVRFP